MSKINKGLILVVSAMVISVFCVACGKVHNEISQVRVNKIAVGNTKVFIESEDVVGNEIDIEAHLCCSTGSGDIEITSEPYFNGIVRFQVINDLGYDVELSHYYYVVKNYYGGGNDYVSPNIAFYGNNYVGGRDINEGDASARNPNEIVTFGQFTENASNGQRLIGGNERIEGVGTKNVIFYLTAVSKTGEILTFSRSIAVLFAQFNQCEEDKIACSGPNYASQGQEDVVQGDGVDEVEVIDEVY